MGKEMSVVADEVSAAGRKPYIIPGGGSNPIGATGYVACAEEILFQLFDRGIRLTVSSAPAAAREPMRVWSPDSAAITATCRLLESMSAGPKELQEKLVYDLVQKTAHHVGIQSEIPRDAVLCFGDYVGRGYSIPTRGNGRGGAPARQDARAFSWIPCIQAKPWPV